MVEGTCCAFLRTAAQKRRARHRRCVGCESRAAEGRRRDLSRGNERRGKRFRDRNRKRAAAASERTGVGAGASKVAFAKANAGERRRAKRAAGQGDRAESEANGDARDTRPKGRDRVAGSAG